MMVAVALVAHVRSVVAITELGGGRFKFSSRDFTSYIPLFVSLTDTERVGLLFFRLSLILPKAHYFHGNHPRLTKPIQLGQQSLAQTEVSLLLNHHNNKLNDIFSSLLNNNSICNSSWLN